MRHHLTPLFLLLSGSTFAAACGGPTEKLSGDGDGDASGGTLGDGDTPGAGDGGGTGTGGALGDGDISGDGGMMGVSVCQPGSVQLCNTMVGDDVCTGIQLCGAEGPAWEACLCPTAGGTGGIGAGGEGAGAQNAGGAGGDDPVEDPDEPSCSDVTACGGDVAGQWNARSSCLSVSGPLDISSLGLGCVSADISGSLEVSGRLSLTEDGQFVDGTTTEGSFALGIAPECRDISGTVVACEQLGGPFESWGFSSVTCLDVANGGCVCAGQVDQAGGLGHISPNASTSGSYSTGGVVLELSSTEPPTRTYSYCALEDSLVITPTGRAALGTTQGTVVFEREQPLW